MSVSWVVLASTAALAQEREPNDGAVEVVLATRDLPADTVVRADDVRTVQFPVWFLPDGAVRSADRVVGHRLEAPVFAHELVHERWVGPALEAPFVAVPDGWVLVPLGAPVVEPGTRHDVVPERTECALLRDVVSAWDAPAAMAVRPEQVDEALLLGLDTPLRLMPVDPERPDCS